MNRAREIPWPRILAEGAAIVVSILLAFGIEAWWSDRQDRRESMLLLSALRAEFTANVQLIDIELKYRRAVKADAEKLLERLLLDTEIQTVQLTELLTSIVWWGKADLSVGAINSLLHSGKLSIVDDPSLRQRLASMPDAYSSLARMEHQDLDTFQNVLMPYLYDNASLPQISNSLSGRPGVGDFSLGLNFPEHQPYDYSTLISDPRFEGILTHKIWDQNDAIMAYTEFREDIVQVIALIDEHLQ